MTVWIPTFVNFYHQEKEAEHINLILEINDERDPFTYTTHWVTESLNQVQQNFCHEIKMALSTQILYIMHQNINQNWLEFLSIA